MRKPMIGTAALLVVGILNSVSDITLAQSVTPVEIAQSNQSRMSEADRQFMIQAIQSGIGEVILGQLAVERAVSPQIREYGQLLVQHHQQVNYQLRQLANEKGVTLPIEPDARHQEVRNLLGQISGIRFDQTFIREISSLHQETISLFQRQIGQGQDQDLRAFALTTIPVLENDWQIANSLTNNLATLEQNQY